VRDQRLDAVEVVIVDVVTTVEVATEVVVAKDVDGLAVGDERVSVDDASSVVVGADVVEIIEDVKDASVVPVEEAAVVSPDEVIGVDVVVVIGSVVRVELSIGLNLIAFAAFIFEMMPVNAKKRIIASIIRTGIDFT